MKKLLINSIENFDGTLDELQDIEIIKHKIFFQVLYILWLIKILFLWIIDGNRKNWNSNW